VCKKWSLLIESSWFVMKDIKHPLQRWAKHEIWFLIIGFLVCQTWRIVKSHIETKRISPLVEIFTNLKGSCPIKQLGIVAFCEQYLVQYFCELPFSFSITNWDCHICGRSLKSFKLPLKRMKLKRYTILNRKYCYNFFINF
jgi:hypothetical protein